MLGKMKYAIKDYTTAINMNPCARYYQFRGVAFDILGEKEEAFKDYSKAIELDPQSSNAYFNRGGDLLLELGRNEEAIQDYNKAIEIDPKNTYAYKNRARAKEELQEVYDQQIVKNILNQ
ncbi:hypothetical protein pb186bvf_016630 [Paramecium bursaria]